jgi:uncharacterized membrane protein YkvA (DUF1232 family)
MSPLWISLAVIVAIAALVLAAGWLLVCRLDAPARSLAERVMRLRWRAKARFAWALVRDPRVPLWVRAIIPALVLYLAMPIDIIPDFIPVLGHLDDVAVVLVAGGLLLRFTPRAVVEELLNAFEQVPNRPPVPDR